MVEEARGEPVCNLQKPQAIYIALASCGLVRAFNITSTIVVGGRATAPVALLWLPTNAAAPRQNEPKWRPAVEDWASETQTYVFSFCSLVAKSRVLGAPGACVGGLVLLKSAAM